MVLQKTDSIKQIIESREGIHISIYLKNRGDRADLKVQLMRNINKVRRCLRSAVSSNAAKEILAPLYLLLDEDSLLEKIKGNIAIFRTKNIFNILSIPDSVTMDEQYVVATTFHVKPLLRWLQWDENSLMLVFGKKAASLYLVSQSSIDTMRAIRYSELLKCEDFEIDEKTIGSVTDWVHAVVGETSLKVFWAGDMNVAKKVFKKFRPTNLVAEPVALQVDDMDTFDFKTQIKAALSAETEKSWERIIHEFQKADKLNLAQKNFFQICKAAAQGKVKKLVLADDITVFGKLDQKTGGLAIHPCHLDHEDDDILDDLAQVVLNSGGEVYLLPRDKVPFKRSAVAIVSDYGFDSFVNLEVSRTV